MALIKEVLTVLEDGRFVVTFGEDQITTLKCDLPENIAEFPDLAKAFLAGFAHARLNGALNQSAAIAVVEGEVI